MDLNAIKINVKADTSEAKSNLESLKNTGESMMGIGKGLTLGLTTPLVAFGVASTMAADALRQTQRKTQVIYGDMAKDLQDWSLENERTYGLGAGTIEGYVGKIGDLTQGMGMGKKESMDMAKGAMELGVQLGNWNGVNADVAINDLTAAIGGSHKAVEKYGVKLNQTVLDEKTRSLGLGDTFNKLSEAEKAEVRYQAIVEASGNAVQFWNDGNRSTAFYLSEIKEQVGNVMENIGAIFLPILDKVVKATAEWASNIAKFTAENPEATKAIVILGGALAALGPAIFIVGKLMALCAAFPMIAATLPFVAGAVIALGLSFLGLNENASQALLELPSKAQMAIASFLQSIVEALPSILEKGSEMLFKLIEGIALAVPTLLQFMWDSLMNLYGLLFNFGPKFLSIGFEFIKNLLDGAIAKFPEFLSRMGDGILQVLANIRAELPEFLQNGIEFVGNMISGITQNMPQIIAKIGELIAKVIGKIVEYLPKFLAEGVKIVGEIAKGLWNNRDAIFKMIGDVIKGAWNSAVEAVKAFVNIGKSIVDNIKTGISNAWSSFTNWVSNKVKSIPIIGNLIKSVVPPQDEVGEQVGIPSTFGLNQTSRMFATPTLDFNINAGQNANRNIFKSFDSNDRVEELLNTLISVTSQSKVTRIELDKELLIEHITEPIMEEMMWKGKNL